MTPNEAIDVARDSIWVMVEIGAPVMLVGLAVGLVVALIQALTQIQEMTLVFVPKILAMFLALLITLPLMGASLAGFMGRISERIAGG